VGAACPGASCTYAGCDPGYADCNTAAPDLNGCETSLTSTTNCSACGVVCSGTQASSTQCDGTTCSYLCNGGYADCNAGTAPDTDGCETATNTPTNCGDCGVVCTTTNASSASCSSGTSCTYACSGGYSDCNVGTAPDTDGCECATPACCPGGACETIHTDGESDPFYDCNALAAWTSTTAMEACVAYATANGKSTSNCSDGWSGCPGVTGDAVCYAPSNNCGSGFCWGYSGQFAGNVAACDACSTNVSTWQ
jgi:hypothetical protein